MAKLFLCSSVFGVFLAGTLALDNGFSKPPMGFNPWNCFGVGHTGHHKLNVSWAHGFNDTVMRAVALSMHANGLQAAGYEYINLDCGWTTGYRDKQGFQIVNKTRYPQGMKGLGDYLHGLGFKFGIYSSASTAQCCSRFYPNASDGSLGYEDVDAKQYAAFGVDYLKYDGCGSQQSSYPAMVKALNNTGRHIYLSVNGWNLNNDPAPIANIWRTTGDDDVDYISKLIAGIFESNQYVHYAGPGHFNDPDMLEVGNYPMTVAESRSHFSLWCIAKAPLIIGTDPTNITSDALEILLNPEAIAINQDALGVQASVVWQSDDVVPQQGKSRAVVPKTSVWAGPLSNGNATFILFNAGLEPASITITREMMLKTVPSLAPSTSMRDVWRHENVGTFSNSYTALVESHDVVFVRLE